MIKLGRDLSLIAFRMEVVVDYSLRFKRELAGAWPAWVAGYSNDYNGYLPSLRALRECRYEAAACWADSVKDWIARKVHEIHQRISEQGFAPKPAANGLGLQRGCSAYGGEGTPPVPPIVLGKPPGYRGDPGGC